MVKANIFNLLSPYLGTLLTCLLFLLNLEGGGGSFLHAHYLWKKKVIIWRLLLIMNNFGTHLYDYRQYELDTALFVPLCYTNRTAREHSKALGMLFLVQLS